MSEVDFDWAWIGKVPGQRDEYGLLRSGNSGRLRPATLARMVSHFSPGSPGGENRDRPEALPWVTFTFAAASNTRYVGVAIREWPRDPVVPVDATGRPIVPTRFFCLPLEDFQEHFGSYSALYEAVRGLDLEVLDRDGGLLRVPVHPRAAGTRTARERLVTEEWLFAAAAAAAALLDGPIALTPRYLSPRYPLEERIAFLDAVAALLPAGTRATLSASTWADNRTSHQIRLVFAQHLRDGGELDPDNPPGSGTAVDPDGAGARYATLLFRLCDTWGPPTILEWLSVDHNPYSFKQPDDIVESLARAERKALLDRIHRRDPAADSGAVDPKDPGVAGGARSGIGADEIGDHLRTVRPFEYLSADLLTVFLLDVTFGNIGLIEKHWVPAALPALIERCRQLAEADVNNPLLIGLLGVARNVGFFADVVAGFLTPWEGAGRVTPNVHDLAIDLVLENWARADGWVPVRNLLAADREATLVMIEKMIDRDRDVGQFRRQDLLSLLDWLVEASHPATRAVLHPFRIVEEREVFQGLVGVRDINSLSGPDDRAVKTLVERAVDLHRLDQMLPVLGNWLRSPDPPFDRVRADGWITFLDNLDLDRRQERLLGERPAGLKPRRSVVRRLSSTAAADIDVGPAGAGTSVELPVRWTLADPADHGEDAGIAWLAHRYDPGMARAGGPSEGEISFFGNGAGRVAVVLSSTTHQDGQGSRAVCCHTAYKDFAARVDVGVAAFCRAALETEESPSQGGRPPGLAVSGPDVAIAETIDAFGFGAVAATAALLIDGPVTIVIDGHRAQRPPRSLRMAFLDAVLALLPSGVRTSFTACTWVEKDIHRFRLAFSGRGSVRDRHLVHWNRFPAVPEIVSGYAFDYYQRLLLLRRRFANTRPIVDSLADADVLTESGSNLDLGFSGHRVAIMTGVNPIIALFMERSGNGSDKSNKDLRKAVERMSDAAAGRSGEVGDDAAALSILFADGNLSHVEQVASYVERLWEFGYLDNTIVALLERSRKNSDRDARIRAGAVAMVRRLRVENPWPVVDRAICESPAAAIELMVQEARVGAIDRVGMWLHRFNHESKIPRELQLFVAVHDDRDSNMDTFSGLDSHGEDAWRALLQVAKVRDRVNQRKWLPFLLHHCAERCPEVVAAFRFIERERAGTGDAGADCSPAAGWKIT